MWPASLPAAAPIFGCWFGQPATSLTLKAYKQRRVTGDLLEPESLRTAIHGCDAVLHVAADYRLWVRNPDAMYRSNVDGTRALLRIAREENVPRFVYTSSVATMGFKTDGTIVDEATPVSLDDMVGHYKRSKFLAEQVAIEAGARRSVGAHPEPDHADRVGGPEADAHWPHHR